MIDDFLVTKELLEKEKRAKRVLEKTEKEKRKNYEKDDRKSTCKRKIKRRAISYDLFE